MLKLKFLIDECVDIRVARAIKDDGFDVTHVAEVMRGAKDTGILDAASREKRILITNDKDFGELIYLRNLPYYGVVLLRLKSNKPDHIIKILKNIIILFGKKLPHSFSVVTENKIKIRYKNKDYS